MSKEKDYAYLIGSEYVEDMDIGFCIKEFLKICEDRKQTVAVYKTLMRIKAMYRKKHVLKTNGGNPFNDSYAKAMGYLYMFTNNLATNGKSIAISKYEYCLALVDEDYLNNKITTTYEKLAFLNANIKVLKPHFRNWKRLENVKKVNMSKATNIKFSGVIDANTEFELDNITEEQFEGIKRFLTALDKSTCTYISNLQIQNKNETWRLK